MMRWLLIQFVLLYRGTLGQFMGGHCRYYPTCSQYAIDAITEFGPRRGGWMAVKRICRCHPWGGSGYDPPTPSPRVPGSGDRTGTRFHALRKTNACPSKSSEKNNASNP